mmetsp:Transcript_42732/g.102992  ORF Transcript_42732/g.102992 Transcript_42732/m.102992 type:complete len:205 (-) Transcript_42732:30-644(-)
MVSAVLLVEMALEVADEIEGCSIAILRLLGGVVAGGEGPGQLHPVHLLLFEHTLPIPRLPRKRPPTDPGLLRRRLALQQVVPPRPPAGLARVHVLVQAAPGPHRPRQQVLVAGVNTGVEAVDLALVHEVGLADGGFDVVGDHVFHLVDGGFDLRGNPPGRLHRRLDRRHLGLQCLHWGTQPPSPGKLDSCCCQNHSHNRRTPKD